MEADRWESHGSYQFLFEIVQSLEKHQYEFYWVKKFWERVIFDDE